MFYKLMLCDVLSMIEDSEDELSMHIDISVIFIVNNNNNDFFCANILEDKTQWRDKTKGLSKLIIENNASMDG